MHVIIGKAEGGVTSEQTKQEELGGEHSRHSCGNL